MILLIFGGAVFEDVVERVDRRVGDREHRAGDETKERRLPARHFRLQQRSDDEVVHFERAVGQPFAVERREGGEPIEVHVEEIDGDRILDVGRVEDAELAVERLAGREELQAPELLDQLPLAVENDDRAFAAHRALQILGDEILQGGRFARAGARDDPVMRGSRALRNLVPSGVARMPANGVPSRNGEGSSRWCGSSSFGGFGMLAARDAGDAVGVVDVALGEDGEELRVERSNEVFDEVAGFDERGERRRDFSVAGDLGQCGGRRFDGATQARRISTSVSPLMRAISRRMRSRQRMPSR